MAATPASKTGKRLSVMAWIEDAYGAVVLVKQAKGSRRWSLPGGKVNTGEALINALRREVREEIGMIAIRRRLPKEASEAAVYFWRRAQHSFEPLSLLIHPAGTKSRHGS
jgi:8-oxo-dGTP pyrophosphatase MutT (NUDIX family)